MLFTIFTLIYSNLERKVFLFVRLYYEDLLREILEVVTLQLQNDSLNTIKDSKHDFFQVNLFHLNQTFGVDGGNFWS